MTDWALVNTLLDVVDGTRNEPKFKNLHRQAVHELVMMDEEFAEPLVDRRPKLADEPEPIYPETRAMPDEHLPEDNGNRRI